MPAPLALLAAPAGFAAGGALATFAPGLLRRRATVERRVVAGLSAVAAATAPGAPTTLTAADLVYKAVLGGLVVYLGARAEGRVVVIAGAIASAGAWWSDALPLPLAATGLALAVTFSCRRSPLTGAVVSAAIVQAVLRLDLEANGASALVATAALLPLMISGYVRTRATERRVFRRTALTAAGLAVVTGSLGVVAAFLAVGPMREAIGAAADGLASARRGAADEARQQFLLARANFDDARATLSSGWAAPSRLVPVVAQHTNFAREVASGGEALAATGVTTADAADVERLRVTDGAVDLAAVAALRDPLRTAADSASAAQRRFESADSDWLLPPLRDRLDRELRRIERAERDAAVAADVVERLPSLLGGETPRRYFLLVQTPSESRALGGFIGSYGEVTATNGKLELTRFGRTADLQTAGDPRARVLSAPDEYVTRYSRFDPAVTWQNVTMSPDGPTVARVVANLYPQSGGSPIDGVIAVDPAGLAALLRITGPVTVEPWPEPLTAENAERVLLFDQYVQLEAAAARDGTRERFLGDVAEAVTRRLTSGTLPAPAQLIDTLAPAVAGGHLFVASLVPEDAELLDQLDIDKRVEPPNVPEEGDYLAVVTQNATGNKIDTFLRRSYVYNVERDGDSLAATLTLTLRNEAPADGLPDYVIGSALKPPLPKGTSRLYTSIYSPWSLSAASLDDRALPMESEVELGRRVYSAYIDVPPGGEVTLRLQLTGIIEEDVNSLRVRHQPGMADEVEVVVDTDDVAAFRLTRDRRVVIE